MRSFSDSEETFQKLRYGALVALSARCGRRMESILNFYVTKGVNPESLLLYSQKALQNLEEVAAGASVQILTGLLSPASGLGRGNLLKVILFGEAAAHQRCTDGDIDQFYDKLGRTRWSANEARNSLMEAVELHARFPVLATEACANAIDSEVLRLESFEELIRTGPVVKTGPHPWNWQRLRNVEALSASGPLGPFWPNEPEWDETKVPC